MPGTKHALKNEIELEALRVRSEISFCFAFFCFALEKITGLASIWVRIYYQLCKVGIIKYIFLFEQKGSNTLFAGRGGGCVPSGKNALYNAYKM